MDNRAEYLDLNIKTTAQNLTGNFADLGSEINCQGYKHLKVYLDITIGDSEGVTLQGLAKRVPGGDGFHLPLAQVDVAEDEVLIDQEILVTNYNTSARQCYDFNLAGVKFLQLQVKAGVAGGGPGNVKAWGVLSNCLPGGRTATDST